MPLPALWHPSVVFLTNYTVPYAFFCATLQTPARKLTVSSPLCHVGASFAGQILLVLE